MRYGIVREAPGLPPAAAQRQLLTAAACELILQEGPATFSGQRRLARLLLGLKRGDEVLVQSLDAFQRSTGELAQLICDFVEVGVALSVVGDDGQIETLPATDDVLRMLCVLAEHEMRWPSRAHSGGASRPNSGSRKLLSKYQIEYARKLHKDGESLRAIGLLFQISPNDVWEALGG